VANGLVVLHLSALDLQGPWLRLHGAEPAAVGTGLLRAEGLGLLLQQGGQGALGDAGRGRLGDFFHGGQIDVEARPVLAKGASGNDLAPLGGQFADLAEVFGGDFGACHRPSCLVLAKSTRGEWLLPFYAKAVCRAK
jgi:hypothetical protein